MLASSSNMLRVGHCDGVVVLSASSANHSILSALLDWNI